MEITNYALSSKQLYVLLMGKNIKYLFHANTISTSQTFIENNALLSRKYVEENSLTQTAQFSDASDVKYDVWDHVFLDGFDLHTKYKVANKYGPVLFRMKLELLVSPLIQNVYITRGNPWYWSDSTTLDKRFYSNLEEVKSHYLTGKKIDAQIMFTFRSTDLLIKLNKFLHSIVLDKPKLLVKSSVGGKINVGDYAEITIRECLKLNGLGHIPVFIRHVGENRIFCACHVNYNYWNLQKYDNFRNKFIKK